MRSRSSDVALVIDFFLFLGSFFLDKIGGHPFVLRVHRSHHHGIDHPTSDQIRVVHVKCVGTSR